MRARLLALENRAALDAAFSELARDIDAGRIRALVLVVAGDDGSLEPLWGAQRSLGAHAGTILRGMVAYAGALMDSEALSTSKASE